MQEEVSKDPQIIQSQHGMKDVTLQKNTTGDWFLRLFKGIAIGIGAILPGLSGGVLAVIFGI